MAGKKISELDLATEVLAGALMEIVQGGASWRIDANLIANIVEGIGREALTVTAGASLDLNNLAVFQIGTIKNAFATETELVAGNAPSSGLAGGDDVTWVVFTFGDVDHITQMAFSPTDLVQKVKIRFRELNVWSAWADIGGGGVDPALEQQVAENTARFLPTWLENRNIDNFDFTGAFPIGVHDTDSIRLNDAPYIVTVLSDPPPSPPDYNLILINVFPRFFSGVAANAPVGGWGDNASLAKIAEDRVAVFNGTDLRIYRIDLDDVTPIAQIGNTYNGFTVGGSEFSSMAYIAENEFCFFDTDSNELVRLSFDGTDVTTVGNPLSIAGVTTRVRLAKLNATDIALGSRAEDNLRLLRFDGLDWSIISTLPITYGGDFDLTSLNSSDVLVATHADGEVNLYNLEDDSFSFLKLVNTFASPAFITITEDATGDAYVTTRDGVSQFVGRDAIEYEIANPEYSDRKGNNIKNVPSVYTRSISSSPQFAALGIPTELAIGSTINVGSMFTIMSNSKIKYVGEKSFLGKITGSVSLRGDAIGIGANLRFSIYQNGEEPDFPAVASFTYHTVATDTDNECVPLPAQDFAINKDDEFWVIFIGDGVIAPSFLALELDLNVDFKGWI